MGSWLALGLGWLVAAVAYATGPDLERFHAAVVEHARFQACFASKVTTGYCRIGREAGAEARTMPVEAIIDRIQRRLAHLEDVGGPPTAALVYHQGSDGVLHTFLLDREGLVAHDARPGVALDELRQGLLTELDVVTRAAARAPTRAIDRPSRPASRPTSRLEVSRAVFSGAVGARLAEHRYRRLLVLPWGPIGVLPLSALPTPDGAVLAEHASVVVLPDLEALTLPLGRLPHGPRSPEELLRRAFTFDPRPLGDGPRLVVGDPAFPSGGDWTLPALPGARAAAGEVAAALGSASPLIGEAATHDVVIAALDRMRDRSGVIYLATHGISDPVDPMHGSFLALADRHLTADEIRLRKNLLRQPLVVLSACQSGLGKAFGGGQFGLSRAFYAAGAGQVVGSLWNVDDAATRALMTSFAAALTGGALPEEALRIAMLDTRRRFADPGAWASFVVFGNPSGRP